MTVATFVLFLILQAIVMGWLLCRSWLNRDSKSAQFFAWMFLLGMFICSAIDIQILVQIALDRI